MTKDLTQAEFDTVHAVLDARDLTEEEFDQLDREAAEGGGPLTEELLAAVKLALQGSAGSGQGRIAESWVVDEQHG